MNEDTTQTTGTLPPLPGQQVKTENPTWWRYGCVPALVLVMSAAAAETGMYSHSLGIGAGVSCLLLVGAILLLRKDFTPGERLFLIVLALLNGTALAVSGSAVNYFINLLLPFLIQFLPHRQQQEPGVRFRTWWGFWFVHRTEAEKRCTRNIASKCLALGPLMLCILVGVVIFLVFLGILATGNPAVQIVWRYIADVWSSIFANISLTDIVIHTLVWSAGLALFGIYTLRRPSSSGTKEQAPRPAEERVDACPLQHLPLCALAGVNLAFLASTLTDACYLWSGSAPEGVSLTQYLHEGAVSITIASAMATGILLLLFRPSGSARRSLACNIAGYLLLLQTLLLAASVYMRLYYQIDTYGYTAQRIRAAEAMLLGVAGLGVLLVYMTCGGSFFRYAKICAGTMLLMVVAFGICNPSYLAAECNRLDYAAHPERKYPMESMDNLAYLYTIYRQMPADGADAHLKQVVTHKLVERAGYFQNLKARQEKDSWKGWNLITARNIALSEEILRELAPGHPAVRGN